MYINLIQIAESFGVSEQVITEWVRKDGMPHVHDRDRILFERDAVMDWAASHGLGIQGGFLSEPAPSLATSRELSTLLRRGGIWRDVNTADLGQLFERIVRSLPGLSPAISNLIVQRLLTPGGITAAPVGEGFALPHPSMRVALGEACALVALIQLNAPWEAVQPPDGKPITRLLFFISPTPRLHVNMLGLLARGIASGMLSEALDSGASDETLLQILAECADRQAPHSAGETR
ncbi:PTS system, nitrogen regulatory IIA component [Desulfomicrobium apsheronum]|uniref:PTS system, nitrogen regulatory IIA component n=1 Tax=Desulfomicrobium apsheronum TaxID=52560 RepID=A0A1I3V7R8_9BACT|nr:PTS sugar transporter subunit IIA [Desulfomicrobium apsheronum]SFJ90416.1 PTS system, nitrogen regulatory IIA component [Desulfomicrobium apsheronum]